MIVLMMMEVLHLITQHGYARVYPNVFGEFPDELGSKVADAMDNARGGFFSTVGSFTVSRRCMVHL